MEMMEKMENLVLNDAIDPDILKANLEFLSVAYKYNKTFRENIINKTAVALLSSEVGRAFKGDYATKLAKEITDAVFTNEVQDYEG